MSYFIIHFPDILAVTNVIQYLTLTFKSITFKYVRLIGRFYVNYIEIND